MAYGSVTPGRRSGTGFGRQCEPPVGWVNEHGMTLTFYADCAKTEIAYDSYEPPFKVQEEAGPGTTSYMNHALSQDLAQSSTEQREVLDKYHVTALHAYFAGIDDLIQT